MIATLQRRELLRVAGQLSDELGIPFAEARTGDPIEGRLGRMVELTSGRFALVEKSREFTLVPWRPVLGAPDRQAGRRHHAQRGDQLDHRQAAEQAQHFVGRLTRSLCEGEAGHIKYRKW
jgi:hypothetical protein